MAETVLLHFASNLNDDETQPVITAALEQTSKAYGGATLLEAKGAYIMKDGSLVVEKAWTIMVHGVEDKTAMDTIAQWLRDQLNQESVGVATFPNSFRLI